MSKWFNLSDYVSSYMNIMYLIRLLGSSEMWECKSLAKVPSRHCSISFYFVVKYKWGQVQPRQCFGCWQKKKGWNKMALQRICFKELMKFHFIVIKCDLLSEWLWLNKKLICLEWGWERCCFVKSQCERQVESIVIFFFWLVLKHSCLLSYIDFHVLSGNSNGNLA